MATVPRAATGRLCAGMVEALCLAALIVVPLFFNPLSVRVFEPEKASLLRSLAVLLVAAAIAYAVAESRRDDTHRLLAAGAQWWRHPLAWAVALHVLVTVGSTALSLVPDVSFWGSYRRLQGAYTTLAYVAVFLGLVATVRTSAQIERVVLVILAVSVPVALYGVVQHRGLDPQAWSGDVSRRVASTMGNPIFLGAYLVMVVPLAVERTATALRRAWREPRGRSAAAALGALTAAIAALQLVALGLTGSRGPALACVAGMGFFLLLWLLSVGRRRLALGVLGLAIVGGVWLAWGQLARAPGIDRDARFGRFSALLDPADGTSRVRILVWEGVARLVAPHAPLVLADASVDRLNALRPLVGYGPEALGLAFTSVAPPELARLEASGRSADRSHNETWDVLATRGMLGLGVYVLLVLSVFHVALGGIGLVRGRDETIRFWALGTGGVVLGAALAVAGGALPFLGLGIPTGLAGGLVAYLAWRAGRGRAPEPATSGRGALQMALAAGVLGHFVEAQVGIATVSTRLTFWCFAALLVAAARPLAPDPPDDRPLRDGLVWGILTALLLVTLSAALTGSVAPDADAARIVRDLTRGVRGALLLATGLVTGALVALAAGRWVSAQARLTLVTSCAGLAAALAAIFLAGQARVLAALVRATPSTLREILENAARLEHLLTRYYLAVFLLVVALGVTLAPSGALRRGIPLRHGAVLGGALASALLAIHALHLRPLHADIALKSAERLARERHWREAHAFHERATRLAPSEAQYWFEAAHGWHEHARQVRAPTRRDTAMAAAIDRAREAAMRSAREPQHVANLGRLYLWWASVTEDPALKRRRGRQAADHLARAARAMPTTASVWVELGMAHLDVLEQPESGVAHVRRALAIDPGDGRAHQVLGDHYARRGLAEADARARAALYRQGAAHYEEAFRLAAPARLSNPFETRLNAGKLYAALGEPRQARRHAREALRLAPGEARERVRAFLRTVENAAGGA